jgi:hypothetical protein
MRDDNEAKGSPLGDTYDRVARGLRGLPDTVKAGPATIETFTPVVELAETWIVTTVRSAAAAKLGTNPESRKQRERGDVIFLQVISGAGGQRFILPPDVADAIARQRDALSAKNRTRAARVNVRAARAAQLAAGVDPSENLRKARAARRKK